MKIIIATAVLVGLTLAEPPPSNSYLPPSAAGRSGGYPSGGPQGPAVVAARSGLDHGLDHDHGHDQGHGHGSHGAHGAQGNGFARSGLGGVGFGGHGNHGSHGSQPQARFGQEQGYDHNAAAFGRNALDESDEPANYNFGYMVNDFEEGTDFGHHEERQEDKAQGEYHVVLPDGRKQGEYPSTSAVRGSRAVCEEKVGENVQARLAMADISSHTAPLLTVSYEADERGFKPHISYEDTEATGRLGGYDSNANNARSGHDSFDNGGHGNHGNHASARSNGY